MRQITTKSDKPAGYPTGTFHVQDITRRERSSEAFRVRDIDDPYNDAGVPTNGATSTTFHTRLVPRTIECSGFSYQMLVPVPRSRDKRRKPMLAHLPCTIDRIVMTPDELARIESFESGDTTLGYRLTSAVTQAKTRCDITGAEVPNWLYWQQIAQFNHFMLGSGLLTIDGRTTGRYDLDTLTGARAHAMNITAHMSRERRRLDAERLAMTPPTTVPSPATLGNMPAWIASRINKLGYAACGPVRPPLAPLA